VITVWVLVPVLPFCSVTGIATLTLVLFLLNPTNDNRGSKTTKIHPHLMKAQHTNTAI